MIRVGRDTHIGPEVHQAINIAGLAAAAYEGDIATVASRLDPDRIANVLGVTAGGRYDGATVETFGEKLFRSGDGNLAVDMLVVPPGAGFPVHVHAGHHLLLCIAGPGTFSLAGEIYDVNPGDLSMIEGHVPHAVGNPYEQAHVLLAFGAPPRELDADDRMTVTDWNGEPLLVATGHDRPEQAPQVWSGHHHDHTHSDPEGAPV